MGDTDGRPPLVITRKDRSAWLCTLPLDRFVDLIKIIQTYQRALDPQFHLIHAGPESPDQSESDSLESPATDDDPTT